MNSYFIYMNVNVCKKNNVFDKWISPFFTLT